MSVTLTGLSHGAPADVGVVLVAPNGDALALMARVGSGSGTVELNNVDLTISDSAADLLPRSTNPVSGTYRPASYSGSAEVFPAPGPGGAYEHPAVDGTATLSSVFGGDEPNGTWNLFVRDFAADFDGSISGGWSLNITTTDHVRDGGFEATVAGDSPYWTEADSVFGTPLCDASCGDVGPRTGEWWAWFGGTADPQTGSLTQSVTIPPGSATLSFYLWINSAPTPGTATLTVKMDATVLQTFSGPVDTEYTLRTFDVSAFAGGTHTLSFNYVNPEVQDASVIMHVDDVSLTHTPHVTATPVVTGTEPASPNQSPFPQVTGTAEEGSTVTLFTNDTCTSASIGSGIRNDFETIGIPVTVPENATTTIYARASKDGQLDSACSSTFVSYTHDSIAPGLVTFLGTSPPSPSQTLRPRLVGTAEPGSTVDLYTTADCTGTPAATGAAEDFAPTGLPVTVPADSTTTFNATATDAAFNTSACSTSSVTYVSDSTAPGQVTLSSVAPASPNPSTTPTISGHRGGGVDGEAVRDPGLLGFAGSHGDGGGVPLTGLDGDCARREHDHVQGDRDRHGGEHLGLLDQLGDLRPAEPSASTAACGAGDDPDQDAEEEGHDDQDQDEGLVQVRLGHGRRELPVQHRRQGVHRVLFGQDLSAQGGQARLRGPRGGLRSDRPDPGGVQLQGSSASGEYPLGYQMVSSGHGPADPGATDTGRWSRRSRRARWRAIRL